MNKHTRQWALVTASISAWTLISTMAPDTPLKTLISAIFLLYLPGKLLSRLILGERDSWSLWADLAASVGLSLILLMTVGLGLSISLPPLGISNPLSAIPLTMGIASVTTLLLAGVIIRSHLVFNALKNIPKLTLDTAIFSMIILAIPVLATLGAISLNNNGTALFSQIMIGLACVVAAALVWKNRPSHEFTLPLGLYAISLGLLLSSSLRGWHITGHDILQEYQVFQLTASHGSWNMALLRDAYNACLSITILPTVLAKLTSLHDPYIFKLIYQFVFALMPVAMYATISRFASKRVAFLAALMFVTFPTFMVDMSMLNRQEIAFFLFVLAFMTIFNEQMSRRPKTILTLILLAGMVVSHYSTSYVALGVLLVAKTLELVLKQWRKLIGHPRALKPWMPLTWTTIAIISLFAYLWNAQITGTSQSISRTIIGVTTSLPHLIDRSFRLTQSSNSVVGEVTDPKQLFEYYIKTVASDGRDLPASEYYSDTLSHQYPVTLKSETQAPQTTLGRFLSAHRVNLPAVFDWVRQSYAKTIQVLIVVSLGVFALIHRNRQMPRQYLFIGMGFFAMILVQVALPPQIIDYGLLRLIHQGLIFLSLPIILVCMRLFGWIHIAGIWHLRIIALTIIAFFLPLSGLLTSITGGYKPTLATSNSGFYYEAYYTHTDEIAGFNWLRKNAPYGAIANADEFARRKMITYINIYARPTMTPNTIAKDSYVYLSHANTETTKIPLYIDGKVMYHSIPQPFLDDTKDQLYSGGKVKIYH